MDNKNKDSIKWVLILLFNVICLFSISLNTTATSNVNVKSFGSTPNDSTDDTQSIQSAIDFQSRNGGGVVNFDKGKYYIDAIQSIKLKDNVSLEFETGTILKAIPNSAERYQMIEIHDVENVNLVGKVKIIGERYGHLGSLGEWGIGISIRGANNINIKDVNISEMWGDGIYIGNTSKQNYSENIKVLNPVITNNRRQGITIVSVKNLEITNSIIKATNGTSPQCGIDIEPNNPTQFLENIKIINLNTDENEGSGLKIYLKNYQLNEHPISILVDSISNIKDGFIVSSLENIKGDLEIGKYQYLSKGIIEMSPSVEPVTNLTDKVIGRAPAGSFVTISVGSQGLGKAQTNTEGKFIVPIPVQHANSLMRVRVSDSYGNYVSNKYVTVVNVKYSDFEETHWANEEVVYLASKQIIKGYPNGEFQPNLNTKRSEAAKMIALALNLPIHNVSSGYIDVSNTYWAKDYIAAVTKAGLFKGNPDGTFAPNDILKRSEMAKVISIAYEMGISGNSYFSDIAYKYWAKGYISGLYVNGIITGYPDGTFRPEQPTSRAEYSVFLARAMNEDFQ